jgi:hypothetical protein
VLSRSTAVQPGGKSTVKPVSSVYIVEFVVSAVMGCSCCCGEDVANAVVLVIIKIIDSKTIVSDNKNISQLIMHV